MVDEAQTAITDLQGDKVRVRYGDHAGQRGVIKDMSENFCAIELTTGLVIHSSRDSFTNYSLAARRAWQKMPKMSGRPRSITKQKRMVSLRIDAELWDELGLAVSRGLIESREKAINTWLRQHLNELLNEQLG